ncbi:MAG: hypothetical protein ACRDTU_20960 [Micromonosporaceae bacterium]
MVDALTRYTLDCPPPKDPPADLAGGHGIWRVMYRTWIEHQPVDTDKGRYCHTCHRLWCDDGCWGFLAATEVLTHMHRYPDGAGLVGYEPMPQVLLGGEPRLTRAPVQS